MSSSKLRRFQYVIILLITQYTYAHINSSSRTPIHIVNKWLMIRKQATIKQELTQSRFCGGLKRWHTKVIQMRMFWFIIISPLFDLRYATGEALHSASKLNLVAKMSAIKEVAWYGHTHGASGKLEAGALCVVLNYRYEKTFFQCCGLIIAFFVHTLVYNKVKSAVRIHSKHYGIYNNFTIWYQILYKRTFDYGKSN